MRKPSRVAVIATAVVIGVAGLGAIVRYEWASPCIPPGADNSVPLPKPEDPPVETVKTYFTAIQAGDYATVNELLGPGAKQWLEPDTVGPSVVGNYCSITYGGELMPVMFDDAEPHNSPPYRKPNFYKEASYVAVVMYVDTKIPDFSGNIGENGRAGHDYWLGRNGPDDIWRIVEGGYLP
jgi:hypothetical protein